MRRFNIANSLLIGADMVDLFTDFRQVLNQANDAQMYCLYRIKGIKKYVWTAQVIG